MLKPKDWLLLVILPFLAAIAIDQATKFFAFRIVNPVDFGPVSFFFFANEGFALGSLKELNKIFTVVLPSSLGGLLLFALLVTQYFLPIYSPLMRSGISLLTGSMISNVLDRIARGYVVDFIQIHAGMWQTGVFNVADALQWVGLSLGLVAWIANGKLLYPVEQRRGRKWIDAGFQTQYCLKLLAAGVCFGLISGAVSYTYVTLLVDEIQSLPRGAAENLVRTFLAIYAGVSAAFFVGLFVTGVHMSHQIVGPVRAFENFLNDFINGKRRQFKLRKSDEFKELEALADNFLKNFADTKGISTTPLVAGDVAPDISGIRSDGTEFNEKDLHGRKAWLIFYRYATCPLCALHLDSLREVIARALERQVAVVAVYESSPEEFEKANCGATSDMLRAAGIPMIADKERKLYRAFKTRRRNLAAFTPKTVKALKKAARKKFRQRAIKGRFGQLPSHFLIDEDGIIVEAFYGKSFVDHIDLDVVRGFIG
ncbi:hypothetical protein EBZ80_00405 [bacterium]|nr:hypothetical protein [bacterium]